MWSPEQYGLFADERSQPFFDLTGRIEVTDARAVADLGCGPGTLTATLATRWPDARVWGVDSSPAMIEAAAARAIPDRLSFELADLAAWTAPVPLDVIVANASLQWVSDHDALLAKLASDLAPGGALAVQMPGNFEAPSHTILRELCESARWASRLGGVLGREAPVATPSYYLDRLHALGLRATVWETTYQHVLQGDDPVLEWTAGTALRPVLARLDAAEQQAFRDEYGPLLRAAYPRRSFGTLFPFRRLFFVAQRAR